MSFGQRIRFIRGNLSRDDFGYLLGGHRNTLSVSENNEAMPQGEMTIRLYELFNVNLNWLFTGNGDPYLDNFDQSSESANLIMEPENE